MRIIHNFVLPSSTLLFIAFPSLSLYRSLPQQGALRAVLLGLDASAARAVALAHLHTTRHAQPAERAAHHTSSCGAVVTRVMHALFPHPFIDCDDDSGSDTGGCDNGSSNDVSSIPAVALPVARQAALQADRRTLAAASEAFRRRQQVSRKAHKATPSLAKTRRRRNGSKNGNSSGSATLPRCSGYSFDRPASVQDGTSMDGGSVTNGSAADDLATADWSAAVGAISGSCDSDNSSGNSSGSSGNSSVRSSLDASPAHAATRTPPSASRGRPPPPRSLMANPSGGKPSGSGRSQAEARPSASAALLEAASPGPASLSYSLDDPQDESSDEPRDDSLNEPRDESSLWSTPGASTVDSSSVGGVGGVGGGGGPSGWASPGRFEGASGNSPAPGAFPSADVSL